MRFIFSLIISALLIAGCDDTRVYEKNIDFQGRAWMVDDTPSFEFQIADTTQTYNLYFNFRNSLDYPFARLFFHYYLQDSAGQVMKKDLMTTTILDPKTGKPFGSSGLGDIYDHQFAIIKAHRFAYKGKHKIKFEQFMRLDTLEGVLAVGVRVEKNLPQE